MCQTNNQVVLKKTLDYNVTIDSGQVKVNGKTINHIELIMSDIVLQDEVYLGFRDIFNSSMLNEFLQHLKENALRVLVGCLGLIDCQAGYNFIFYYIKEEVELICFTQELKRDD